MFDIAVIGGGIVGCSVLQKLSHYDTKAVLLEKGDDVAVGTTRANSGIVHAGFDAKSGTLKAKFNVLGNKMYPELCRRLHVAYRNIGALVMAGKGMEADLKALIDNGVKNGVEGLQLLNRKQIELLEPNIADEIDCALYAPTSGVVSPFGLTVALAENAVRNGQKVLLNTEVSGIERCGGGYKITTNNGVYEARVVINCAGADASGINGLAGAETFETEFRRGDYYLFDNSEYKLVNHTCFMLPTPDGKGVLVTPNADETLMAGPTSEIVEDGSRTAVEADGLKKVRNAVPQMVKHLDFSKCIRVFAGVRTIAGKDFIIENSKLLPDYITVGGICSPGLTAAPAIAEYVVEDLMQNTSLMLKAKTEPHIENPKPVVTRDMPFEEWQKLAEDDKHYSTIVCRCEKITQGEILQVLKSPLCPVSLDAIKRRVRAGMGRCQGGFCTSKLLDLISSECGITKEKITKCGAGSEIIVAPVEGGH